MKRFVAGSLFGLACLTVATAQDSVSKNCTVGDAVSPWADATDALGSEQCNTFVVDLAGFQSSWGNGFQIAPLLKSSKTSPNFTSSLISAQAMSRLQELGVDYAANSYGVWNTPGEGVNNDPNLNDLPAQIQPEGLANQFAVGFAEFSGNHNGLVGGIVNYDPADLSRLYVKRVVAATNGANANENIAQFGIGAIDSAGNFVVRADDFGLAGGACPTISGNNIYSVNINGRACDIRNVISGNMACDGDVAATCEVITGSGTTHSAPSILPSLAGGPVYFGPTFNTDIAYRAICSLAGGNTTAHRSNVCASVTDQRGAAGYHYSTDVLGGTAGFGGILGKIGGITTVINLWGMDATGAPQGTLALELPTDIFDCDGFKNDSSGLNEFDHYHSQAAFRGNAQVAVGRDQLGNVLASAVVDHPIDGGSNWPIHYIPVARFNPNDQGCPDVEWTMAGYVDPNTSFGKPILDGPGGNTVGRMTVLANVTGGSPLGPSVSSPMIDSVGNVYFLSAVELYSGDPNDPNTFTDFDVALLRAVLDPVSFCYELELLFALGDTFPSMNTGLEYRITFMGIADSNSISSGTAFSGNISQTALAGIDPAMIDATASPSTLGGLVINAEIVYDVDRDGLFDDGLCPGGLDEAYNVLLYVQGAGEEVPGCGPGCDVPGGDADLDDDCDVDLADLAIVLGNFGGAAAGGGDTNNDGSVDLSDLANVLGLFGTACP